MSLLAAPKWQLTFSQEFDGPTGRAPDSKAWVRDLGANGWGNGEWESYTGGNRNAYLDGKGHLVIEARKEGEKSFTSARMNTRGRFSQTYGRFEARIKMPYGKGIWPAFWMLGANDAKVGWPGCGEIDIMEFLGHEPRTVHGTVHGPGYSGTEGKGKALNTGVRLDEGFHTYALEWEPERLRWLFDGKVYHTVTPNDLGPHRWVYDHPFFLILNLAVGGGWPGYPDATTRFPQRLTVDYVRVYRDRNQKVDKVAIQRREERRLRKLQEFKGPVVHNVPGTILAADFARCKDLDPYNQGGFYRPLDAADIGTTGKADPKYGVGWTAAGEWLSYDLSIPRTGSYTLETEVASGGEGGVFHFEVDRVDVTGPMKVPDTGGWQAWKPVRKEGVRLPSGRHELRLVFDRDGKTGSVGNIDLIRFR